MEFVSCYVTRNEFCRELRKAVSLTLKNIVEFMVSVMGKGFGQSDGVCHHRKWGRSDLQRVTP
jgi:hypothetical protein